MHIITFKSLIYLLVNHVYGISTVTTTLLRWFQNRLNFLLNVQMVHMESGGCGFLPNTHAMIAREESLGLTLPRPPRLGLMYQFFIIDKTDEITQHVYVHIRDWETARISGNVWSIWNFALNKRRLTNNRLFQSLSTSDFLTSGSWEGTNRCPFDRTVICCCPRCVAFVADKMVHDGVLCLGFLCALF